jgi:hypothetical protein
MKQSDIFRENAGEPLPMSRIGSMARYDRAFSLLLTCQSSPETIRSFFTGVRPLYINSDAKQLRSVPIRGVSDDELNNVAFEVIFERHARIDVSIWRISNYIVSGHGEKIVFTTKAFDGIGVLESENRFRYCKIVASKFIVWNVDRCTDLCENFGYS